jgi:hypothetical protein
MLKIQSQGRVVLDGNCLARAESIVILRSDGKQRESWLLILTSVDTEAFRGRMRGLASPFRFDKIDNSPFIQ